METILFFLFSLMVYVAVVADPNAEDGKKEKKEVNPFVYDYHSLRICGLVFGVVLFTLGILLILSRKCRCSSNQEKKPKAPGDEEATAETLIVSKAPEYDPDAEFVYDYQTLCIGGLTFVAVIMILSVLLLATKERLKRNTYRRTAGHLYVVDCNV
ncbi:unnamed protein product [Coregonus sp. 'balchen']|nr:unnamed protein product [Coregonus sp. 'balchen']